MKTTKEEKKLLEKLKSGLLDGRVGRDLETSGGSTIWTMIKNGLPECYKEGPGGRFFNGKENERYSGKRHILTEYKTDEQKLFFLYNRPLVNTICSGSHYNSTAISIQIV